MQHLEVSGAVRPLYGLLGFKELMLLFLLIDCKIFIAKCEYFADGAQLCGSCICVIFSVNIILLYGS
jgi:hypothetical protein